MENAIITDEEEIQHQFKDLYTYLQQIPQKIAADTPQQPSEIFLLARTTTPRTLPSNMFLAVGENIEYSMVYDFASKEYYILATNLLKKYYKNPEDYLTIRTLKGKELQGLYYKPLFDYITTPFSKGGSTEGAGDFAKREKYLNQFFQILNADFVSTEDGTGIVHIAPTFGEEDFQVVAKLL
jgi:isoleucyl-tRNA synthetase